MIVVTGATGNVGRPLVRMLAAAGEEVTAVSRTAAADLPEGVRHVAADLTDTDSLAPAFAGADALYLLFAPGSFHADVRGLLASAAAAGVRRVVLQSSQGVATRPESPSHGQLGKAIEDAVRASGLSWTILRPGGFQSNALAWVARVRTEREVSAPFGEVAIPFVDPEDIAAVAAATLREDGHDGQIYVLTGPVAESPRERVRALSEALGEPVRFLDQSPAQARTELLAIMPPDVADTTLAILGAPTDAERRISPDVERVLGRAPRPFAAWAQRTVAAFR
ncbi:NAD(P)H-binding protein [Nocardia otitidiscaviarum]|uniref:NAD(P)H-binding protein n=1 Tax=Nocardia otitidiscaviarum TaxID=1823 RepID=UPI0018938D0C|nr:NAD(P)H-binding protein [Nocardia otitidiscaviarum]MBF6135381.1 NAD(P)H-binding protein [Nocardia otitidiscaviarum]MBF6237354.1 NAD(P)H-binding protein [Nocardia otitidiscaviarum]